MVTNKDKQPQIRVVLRKPRAIAALLTFADAVYSAMTANVKLFPSPTPPLAQLSSDIAAAHTAEVATTTRTAGTVQTRNAKLAAVLGDLEGLRAYVQTVANATPDEASAIAVAAGMALRKPTSASKAPLAVKKGPASGAVTVEARVGTGSHEAHEWQWSTDGKTWTSVPSTLQGKTTITGLTAGTLVYVRHRSITRTGDGAWDDPVSAIVT